MSIPKNITKEDLTKGAEKILREGIPSNGHSSTYDVFYKKHLLPPKLVVSYANLFRNGEELNRNNFEGGVGTESFRLLEENGFKIFIKGSIYPTLIRFLEQAEQDDLKTSHYPKMINGLSCKISFGQGNQARIPWISLLKDPNTTSKGIYPVYLYYKDNSKLILAYGVSETNKPNINWNVQSDKISDYFKKKQLGKPQRYGDSYVFKVYEANNLPKETEIESDLENIIHEYNEVIMISSKTHEFAIKKELSADILLAFQKWYDKSDHKAKEDYYQSEVDFNQISNKSDDELIDFFVQFKKDGGKIQSTDNRGIEKFKNSIEDSIDNFRQFILEPFTSDFDVIKWLDNLHNFKNFGIGTATIYLNRVDKFRFPPLNNKVREAFNLIGNKNLPTSDIKAYPIVNKLSQQLINLYNCFDNYFHTDAFTQYIIGEEEGKVLINKWVNEGLIENKEFVINDFQVHLEASGLIFTQKLITRFVSSLITKPFVILSGLSGSGKTKLAQSFVQWICQDKSQYRIIPVGADWTNREPLLGYPNALKPEEYVKPDSGVLDLIIQAITHADLPHFLILDEMNLSHVERYFADFLSVMESKEEIPLYAVGTDENGVPSKLQVPPNLFIIGTVNIDETTNMFSPKVLDRANTIEFRVSDNEMESFLKNIKEINMEALNTRGAGMARSFLQLSDNKSFATKDIKDTNESLIQFFRKLKKTGAEFGYRSATEILRLINQLTVLDDTLSTNEKVDIAIIQKLLPKLHGSRRKLCPVLVTLGSFCIEGEIKIEKAVFENENFDFNAPSVLYPLSLEKIARMYKGAIDNGFASFAEA